MQIQRTGYQQNFGSAVSIPINYRLYKTLQSVDSLVSRGNHRTIAFVNDAQTFEALCADGDEARFIGNAGINSMHGLAVRVHGNLTELGKKVMELKGRSTTIVIPEEVSTPEALMTKVPMLRQFSCFIESMFR